MSHAEVFETVVPVQALFVGAMDENRLLAVAGVSGVISEDVGRTWGTPFPFLQDEKPLDGTPYAVLRLNNGCMGMLYGKKDLIRAPGYATPCQTWCFCSSADDGKNWSSGVPLDIPSRYEDQELGHEQDKGVFIQHPYGSLLQLKSGRLLMTFYWYFGGRHQGWHRVGGYGTLRGRRVRLEGHTYEVSMGGCYVYFSDDLGRTWSRSTGSAMVWPLPSEGGMGGFGPAWEPVVVELQDGGVLMFLRTQVGRLFQSVSQDGGDHWSLPAPTELSSSDAPCALGRAPGTGDLMVIWNQVSSEEIQNGYPRGRLSVATSKDEGKSWGHFKTVEQTSGMQPAGQIQPGPIRHVRVREEVGVLNDHYTRYYYPWLAFVQGKAVMLYWVADADVALYGVHLEAYQTPPRRQLKMKAVPEEWLYDK